ncbi:sensor histidine kinase [Streptomyces sp. 11x1]|uniref:sensor histidine kinase n=1 Tax=Streptomyces sp. 11x1 TaxID=3038642 RepID=UPI0037D99A5C
MRTEAPGAVLAVRDGGPGLTDDDIAVVFERGTLTGRYRGVRPVGSGLGLAIAHRPAGRLGAAVTAHRPPPRTRWRHPLHRTPAAPPRSRLTGQPCAPRRRKPVSDDARWMRSSAACRTPRSEHHTCRPDITSPLARRSSPRTPSGAARRRRAGLCTPGGCPGR